MEGSTTAHHKQGKDEHRPKPNQNLRAMVASLFSPPSMSHRQQLIILMAVLLAQTVPEPSPLPSDVSLGTACTSLSPSFRREPNRHR